MPEMNAVEVADGRDSAARQVRRAEWIADDVQRQTSAPTTS
jgi:hypothetical protein